MKQKLIKNQESATMQSAKQNATSATARAESENASGESQALESPEGAGRVPRLCSGLDAASVAVFNDASIGTNHVGDTATEVKLSGSQKVFELLTSDSRLPQ